MDTGPQRLQGKSVEEGLRIEARALTDENASWATLVEMVPVYKKLVADKRVLTLRLEDFTFDYEINAALLLRHMFRLEKWTKEAVLKASKVLAVHDIARWNPKQKELSGIPAPSDKDKVMDIIQTLVAEGDKDILKVKSFEPEL